MRIMLVTLAKSTCKFWKCLIYQAPPAFLLLAHTKIIARLGGLCILVFVGLFMLRNALHLVSYFSTFDNIYERAKLYKHAVVGDKE